MHRVGYINKTRQNILLPLIVLSCSNPKYDEDIFLSLFFSSFSFHLSPPHFSISLHPGPIIPVVSPLPRSPNCIASSHSLPLFSSSLSPFCPRPSSPLLLYPSFPPLFLILFISYHSLPLFFSLIPLFSNIFLILPKVKIEITFKAPLI